MRDIEVTMNWRHFLGATIGIFAVLLLIGGVIFTPKLGDITCFALILFSLLLSILLSTLACGLHAIRRDWRAGKIYPSDVLTAALVVFGPLGVIGALSWLLPEPLWKYLWWSFWSVMIVRGILKWHAKHRAG